MEKAICATLLSNIDAKFLLNNAMQEFEYANEVGFARSIRPNEYVQPLQIQFRLANGFKTSNLDLVYGSHGLSALP